MPFRVTMKELAGDIYDICNTPRVRGCTGKICYPEKTAITRAMSLYYQHRNRDSIRAYPCENCGHWHIGNTRKRTT